MAERLNQKIIERSVSKIPKDILNKLSPYANQVEDLLRIPLDFAHGPLHVAEVRQHTRAIIDTMTNPYSYGPHLTPTLSELEKIDQAVTLHDSGYVFAKLGVLKPSEHHYGSWFIAQSLGLSEEVSWGILNHQRDRMPESYPLWVWILNTSDRLAGMGFSGVLREIYYLGYKHPVFENPLQNPEQVVDLRDIRKIRYKTKHRTVWCFPAHDVEYMSHTDYEWRIKLLITKEVLPNLDRKQKKTLAKKTETLLDRYDGDADGGITSIIMDVMDIFEHKYFNTTKINQMLTSSMETLNKIQ